jgi:hypothetical protein
MSRLYVLLASVVIATLLLAVASGASAGKPGSPPGAPLVGKPKPTPPKYYGALVVSPSVGPRSYWASNSSLDLAIRNATNECRRVATYCRAGVWVKNGYAAFAMDANGAWGTGWGSSEARAVLEAKIACQFWGGDVACDDGVQTYRTTSYSSSVTTSGGIPYIPPPVTGALPPAATGTGVGGPAQDR